MDKKYKRDSNRWRKAAKHTIVLLKDALDNLEQANAERTHLDVIRSFMYSTHAVAQWIRYVWANSELYHLKSGWVTELCLLCAVMEKIRAAPNLVCVMEHMDDWSTNMREAMYNLPRRTQEFEKEHVQVSAAFSVLNKHFTTIIESPTITDAGYDRFQVPQLETRVLKNEDGSIYYADGEVLNERPVGEVALIAGARIDRMWQDIREKMDDAMGVSFDVGLAQERLFYNSVLVRASYEQKLHTEGISHGGQENTCSTNATADRRVERAVG